MDRVTNKLKELTGLIESLAEKRLYLQSQLDSVCQDIKIAEQQHNLLLEMFGEPESSPKDQQQSPIPQEVSQEASTAPKRRMRLGPQKLAVYVEIWRLREKGNVSLDTLKSITGYEHRTVYNILRRGGMDGDLVNNANGGIELTEIGRTILGEVLKREGRGLHDLPPSRSEEKEENDAPSIND